MATTYLIIGSEEYESQLSEFIYEEAQYHKDDIERGDWAELFKETKRKSNCFCVHTEQMFLELTFEEFKEFAAPMSICGDPCIYGNEEHTIYIALGGDNGISARLGMKFEGNFGKFDYETCCELRDALIKEYLPKAVSQLFQDYEAHFVLGDSEESGYERYDCTLCEICYHTNENTDYYVQEATYQGRTYRSDEEAKATLTLADVEAIRAEAELALKEKVSA